MQTVFLQETPNIKRHKQEISTTVNLGMMKNDPSPPHKLPIKWGKKGKITPINHKIPEKKYTFFWNFMIYVVNFDLFSSFIESLWGGEGSFFIKLNFNCG